MKLLYTNTTKEDGLVVVGEQLVFMCAKPVVVQPSEIVKVPVGVQLQIEPGFVLNLGTHPALVSKLGEIFPAFTVISTDNAPHRLDSIPVRNAGRNPIHIMVGDLVACGHVVQVEPLEKEEADFTPTSDPAPRSKPQKKNPNFQFEMRN